MKNGKRNKAAPLKKRKVVAVNKGKFVAGKKKTGGRAKGTPNKLTSTVRQGVLDTFNELQSDKKANLLSWAQRSPTEFYKIAARLIPTEITGGDGKPLIPPADLSKLTDAELRTLIALQSKSRVGAEKPA